MINDDGSHLLIWLWSNSREYTGPGHPERLTDAATVFCKCSFCHHCAVTRCRPRNSTFVFLRCEDAPSPLPDAPWGRELHLIWHKLPWQGQAADGSGPGAADSLTLFDSGSLPGSQAWAASPVKASRVTTNPCQFGSAGFQLHCQKIYISRAIFAAEMKYSVYFLIWSRDSRTALARDTRHGAGASFVYSAEQRAEGPPLLSSDARPG